MDNEVVSAEMRAVSAACGLTVGVVLNRVITRSCKKRGHKKMAVYFNVSLPLAIAYNGYQLVTALKEMDAVHKLEMAWL